MKEETRNEILSLNTEQKVFDYVTDFLVTQGKQSIDFNNGECQYYGPGDLRCAVGCLILPEEYEELWDSDVTGAKEICNNIPRLKPFYDLLSTLQNLHDLPLHWNQDGMSTEGLEKITGIADYHRLIFSK